MQQTFHRAGNDPRFGADKSAYRAHVVYESPAHDAAWNKRECEQDQKRKRRLRVDLEKKPKDDLRYDRKTDQFRKRRFVLPENL